jgi:hypothetical protein
MFLPMSLHGVKTQNNNIVKLIHYSLACFSTKSSFTHEACHFDLNVISNNKNIRKDQNSSSTTAHSPTPVYTKTAFICFLRIMLVIIPNLLCNICLSVK